VTSRGLELEAVANLAPGLKVIGGVSRLRSLHQQGYESGPDQQGPDQHAKLLTSGWAITPSRTVR